MNDLKLSAMHVGFCPVILWVIWHHYRCNCLLKCSLWTRHCPILLDNLACTGTEYNLTSCSYDSDRSDCGHYEDAGVHCNTTCEYSVVCTMSFYAASAWFLCVYVCFKKMFHLSCLIPSPFLGRTWKQGYHLRQF